MNAALTTDIKKMTIPERILLVEEIWDSIFLENEYADLTEPQRIELEKRSDSYHANPQQGRSWNDIKQEFWRNHV